MSIGDSDDRDDSVINGAKVDVGIGIGSDVLWFEQRRVKHGEHEATAEVRLITGRGSDWGWGGMVRSRKKSRENGDVRVQCLCKDCYLYERDTEQGTERRVMSGSPCSHAATWPNPIPPDRRAKKRLLVSLKRLAYRKQPNVAKH